MPSEIENEDWHLLKSIMDYRLLISARDQHNQDASKMTPEQVRVWKDMVEAVEEDG